jgi:DNA-binding transcriptional MocR family regulator
MMEELRTIRDRLGKKLSTLTPEEQQVKINSLDKSDPAKEKPRAPKRASTKAPLPKSQAQRMTVKISALPALKSKLPNVGTTIFSVMSKLAQETGAINLSQGFPDFPIDEKLSELTHAAMKAGHNQYAPMPGLPALRDAIAAKVERLYDFSYDPDTEITVTAGATQALFTALGAIVRPGDEVVIIDPAYDCYAPTVELFGGIPVHVRFGQRHEVRCPCAAQSGHAENARADDQHAAQSGGHHPARCGHACDRGYFARYRHYPHQRRGL